MDEFLEGTRRKVPTLSTSAASRMATDGIVRGRGGLPVGLTSSRAARVLVSAVCCCQRPPSGRGKNHEGFLG